MSDLEFAQAMTEAVDAIRYRHRRTMLGGRRIDADTVTLAGAPAGKSWVRGFDLSREQTAVWGTVNSINAPVEIDRQPDGDYEIVSPDWSLGVVTHGDAVRGVTQPPVSEATPGSIGEVAFTPGRLQPSTLGGLYVHTQAFDYDAGRHLGGLVDGGGNFDATAYDESVAAYVPGSSGQVCWVRRDFDPFNATFSFSASTPESWPSVDYLNEATLWDIPLVTGRYPVGAVALAYGQTTVQGGRFASARFFLGKKEVELNDIMMSADGFPMVDADGYYILRS